MTRLIPRNSGGVDKEPLLSDLLDGELAVNTVTGTMYHKITTPGGKLIASTRFQNFYNITPVALFTVPLNANEGDIVLVNIANYDPTVIYNVNVTGGVIDTTSNPFKWTMPSVSTTITVGISISTRAVGKLESLPTTMQYIDVANVSGIIDAAIILNGLNITPAEFVAIPPADGIIANNAISITTPGTAVETINFQQEAIDTDWSKVKQSVTVRHQNIIDPTFEQTLEVISTNNSNGIVAGDTVYVEDNNNVQEVTVGAVVSEQRYQIMNDVQMASKDRFVFLGNNGEGYIHTAGGSIEVVNDVIDLAISSSIVAKISKAGQLYIRGTVSYAGNVGMPIGSYLNWTPVPGITGCKRIIMNYSFSFVIKTDGSIMSTGYNNSGQLGLGNSINKTVFTNVPNLSNIIDIRTTDTNGGNFTLALSSNGDVYGSGYNVNGELGLGNNLGTATFILTKSSVNKIYVHNTCSVLLLNDGTLVFSGRNYYSMFGSVIPSNTVTNNWVDIGFTGCSGIFLSLLFAIVYKLDGTIHSCGYNANGQLGLGSTASQLNYNIVPGEICDTNINIHTSHHVVSNTGVYVDVQGKIHMSDISTGNIFTPSTMSTLLVKKLSGFTPPINKGITFKTYNISTEARVVTTASNTSYYIDPNGELFVRGLNQQGLHGLGVIDYTIVASTWVTTGLVGVKSIHTGFLDAYALMLDGTVMVCGYNQYGQLGLGSTVVVNTWTQIPGLTGVRDISVFVYSAYIVKDDGSVWGAGYNVNGELGLGNNISVNTFIRNTFPGRAISVKATDKSSMIVAEDGTVWTSGVNTGKRFGERTAADELIYRKIENLNGVVKAVCGNLVKPISYFLMETGEVWWFAPLGRTTYGPVDYTLYNIPQVIKNLPLATDIDIGGNGAELYIIEKATNNLVKVYNTFTTITTPSTPVKLFFSGNPIRNTFVDSNDNMVTYGTNNYNAINNSTVTNISAPIIMDSDLTILAGNFTPDTFTTKLAAYDMPLFMYKKGVGVETSLTATATKSFIPDVMDGAPVPVNNGLKYSFLQVTGQGRFLSTKITGLNAFDTITEIRSDLEKL